jgi:HprK-related kinase A
MRLGNAPRPRRHGWAQRFCVQYRIGPFVVRLRTPIRPLLELVRWCYADAELATDDALISFDVSVGHGPRWRSLFAPQAVFSSDGETPFEPFPLDHAFPMLEWGLNWCAAMRAHQYLMLHAGVLERNGLALILPAIPGSGKSTLSAALALSGWRLLSDEFGLLDYRQNLIQPFPRAIPLKNLSIDVIRAFSAEAQLGPIFAKTRKGEVAHLRPPEDSLLRQHELARPAWIVFPRYIVGSPLRLRALHKSVAFVRLSQNAFNYRLLGAAGFLGLRDLVRDCRCWSAEFSDLAAMISALNKLPQPGP